MSRPEELFLASPREETLALVAAQPSSRRALLKVFRINASAPVYRLLRPWGATALSLRSRFVALNGGGVGWRAHELQLGWRPFSSAVALPSDVLVKIGGGEVCPFSPEADVPLESMDRMAILKALAMDKGFCVKLSKVALDDCKVFLLYIAGKKPTAAEEEAAIELEAGDTIGVALQAADKEEVARPAGNNKLFIRVYLPGTAPKVHSE